MVPALGYSHAPLRGKGLCHGILPTDGSCRITIDSTTRAVACQTGHGILGGGLLAMLPYNMLKLATTPPSISWGGTFHAIGFLYTFHLTHDVSSHHNQERSSHGFQNAGTGEGQCSFGSRRSRAEGYGACPSRKQVGSEAAYRDQCGLPLGSQGLPRLLHPECGLLRLDRQGWRNSRGDSAPDKRGRSPSGAGRVGRHRALRGSRPRPAHGTDSCSIRRCGCWTAAARSSTACWCG